MKVKLSVIIWLVLAVASTAYGFLVKSVGSGTGFYKVWLAIAVLCVLLAVACYFGVWGKLPGVLRKVIVGILSVCLAVFIGVEGCVLSQFGADGDKDMDYIIVLGAQIYATGPSTVLKYRLDRAVEYLDENPDTVCIVTGGQGYNEPCAESEVMAEYLEAHGISADRILQENKATNTVQNIQLSKKLMNSPEATVGIVTNNFHVFRGVQLAKKQGLVNAKGIASPTTPAYLPNNMFREFFGVVKDVLVGNM